MADRQVIHQNIVTLLAKLDDPDADLRFMSLNDLFGILSSPASGFLSGESRISAQLTDGLLKALEDQHGDVQNQSLKWYLLATSLPKSSWLTCIATTVSVRWLFGCPPKHYPRCSRS